ncbi:MAG: protein-glutamate O-methyltransferase [Pseudomonadota bacterium]
MKPEDFEFVSQLLYKQSGLVLNESKSYLLESRLGPIARGHDFKDVDELAVALKGSPTGKLVDEVVDAMTTNESFFFRDQAPFDRFNDTVLPKLLETRANTRKIRIWSAACSSGQEPYTLAMLLDDRKAELSGWKIEIVATDISPSILEKAQEGLYTQFEVQRGLPIRLLAKFFKQEGDRWRIDAGLRRMVSYKAFNLLDSFATLGKFDVVFCRNVLIYFDQKTKSDILGRMAAIMPEDGFLYLGGAETVLGVSDRFQLMPGQRGLYGLSDGKSAGLAKTGT